MAGLTQEEYDKLDKRLHSEFSDYREMAGGYEYRYHHLIRVHRYVKKLMNKPEIREKDFDEKVVEVAALFHDIGRKEDIEDGYLDPIDAHEGHGETGGKIVDEFIEDVLTKDQLEKVKQVITNHHHKPKLVETRIVRDADRLGLFGVMNFWRMSHYASDKELILEDQIQYFWGDGMEQREEKLEKLNFDVSRKIAEKRFEYFKQVMERIEVEHEGEDI